MGFFQTIVTNALLFNWFFNRKGNSLQGFSTLRLTSVHPEMVDFAQDQGGRLI
jgi:hypothetical protein